MVALNHGLLPSLQILGGDFQASLNVLIHEVLSETMDRDSSLRQRIPCLILSEPSLTHLHARGLRDPENLVCAPDGLVQSSQSTLKSSSCLITNVACFVTLHTDTVRTSPKLRVSWMADAMIAMTHDAPWKRGGFEGFLVRTFFVHLGLESVTVRTHILNLVHSWRRRAMVPVAGCTGWRTQITSHGKRFVVHARAVLCELIRGNGISLHVVRVRMAARARVRHVDRIHRGSGITGRP